MNNCKTRFINKTYKITSTATKLKYLSSMIEYLIPQTNLIQQHNRLENWLLEEKCKSAKQLWNIRRYKMLKIFCVKSARNGNRRDLGIQPFVAQPRGCWEQEEGKKKLSVEEGVAGKAGEKKLKTKVQSRFPFRTKQQLARRHGQGSSSLSLVLRSFSFGTQNSNYSGTKVNWRKQRLTRCFWVLYVQL